jgi:hypothetical protein
LGYILVVGKVSPASRILIKVLKFKSLEETWTYCVRVHLDFPLLIWIVEERMVVVSEFLDFIIDYDLEVELSELGIF